MIVTTKSLEETYKLSKQFIDKALLATRDGAFVVLLKGDLGSGKTSFVQGVARALLITEHVTSPTFVVMKNYPLNATPYTLLTHVDAYRLEGEKDLGVLGWEELVKNPQNIVLVEWPEKAELTDYPTINFTFIDENTRQIELP